MEVVEMSCQCLGDVNTRSRWCIHARAFAEWSCGCTVVTSEEVCVCLGGWVGGWIHFDSVPSQ